MVIWQNVYEKCVQILFVVDFGPERLKVAMLNEYWLTKIKEEDIGIIGFQQDGATCHTTESTLNVFALFLKIVLSTVGLIFVVCRLR